MFLAIKSCCPPSLPLRVCDAWITHFNSHTRAHANYQHIIAFITPLAVQSSNYQTSASLLAALRVMMVVINF